MLKKELDRFISNPFHLFPGLNTGRVNAVTDESGSRDISYEKDRLKEVDYTPGRSIPTGSFAYTMPQAERSRRLSRWDPDRGSQFSGARNQSCHPKE